MFERTISINITAEDIIQAIGALDVPYEESINAVLMLDRTIADCDFTSQLIIALLKDYMKEFSTKEEKQDALYEIIYGAFREETVEVVFGKQDKS